MLSESPAPPRTGFSPRRGRYTKIRGIARPGFELLAGETMTTSQAVVEAVRVAAYTVPTDAPEADGTYAWDSTTLVTAEVRAGGQTGLGYTYADGSIVQLIQGKLGSVISGHSAFEIAGGK